MRLQRGGPGVEAAQITSPAGLIDVAPTILAALGLRVPPTMLGQPLAAFGAPAPPWREIVAQSGRNGYRQEVVVRHAADASYLMRGSTE